MKRLMKHIDTLIARYPVLDECRESIIDAYTIMEESYTNGGKLLIAGNGGSAADSEHMAGELMKRFRLPRPVPADFADRLAGRSTGCRTALIGTEHYGQHMTVNSLLDFTRRAL
ncbi:MAG: SIS domain-containing protein [Synergistaceae bacterium]|nr:SIS domain-containing protein [Synergistaceae bacterium]